MNNYMLNSADRLTHLKIVAVSLVAGISKIPVTQLLQSLKTEVSRHAPVARGTVAAPLPIRLGPPT